MLYPIALFVFFVLFTRSFSGAKRYVWMSGAFVLCCYTPLINPFWFAGLVTLKAMALWYLVDVFFRLVPAAFVWQWSISDRNYMFAAAPKGVS